MPPCEKSVVQLRSYLEDFDQLVVRGLQGPGRPADTGVDGDKGIPIIKARTIGPGFTAFL